MKNYAIRTVKEGRVRIGGRCYAPQVADKPYDGRFEGQRFAFSLYRRDTSFVHLCGTERDFKHVGDTPVPDWGKPPVCVDGVFEFEWWDEVAASTTGGGGRAAGG